MVLAMRKSREEVKASREETLAMARTASPTCGKVVKSEIRWGEDVSKNVNTDDFSDSGSTVSEDYEACLP